MEILNLPVDAFNLSMLYTKCWECEITEKF